MTYLRTTAAALAFAVMAGAASAASVVNNGGLTAGDDGYVTDFLRAGSVNTYTFTADTRLRILDFFSVTASSSGRDAGPDFLRKLRFGYDSESGDNTTDTFFARGTITRNGATSTGTADLPGFVLAEGESFTFTFDNSAAGTGDLQAGASFATAAVPLPASGLLLLTVLGGGAALSRRKKSKA